jgi:hypothetical protein
VLASAAAGSVLEIGDDVHRLGGFCFFVLRNVLLLPFPPSGLYPLSGYCFCPDPYGPDEAQQFTSNCGGDLSLILACCCAFHAISLTSSEILSCRLRNPYLRKMLVQGAHYILGHRGPDTDLKRWGLKLAARGGKRAKKAAVIAVARNLGILLHRL